MTAPRVEISIDELVFRGLSPGDAHVAAAALEAGLLQRASEAGAPARARDEAFRRLPAVDAQAGSPSAVGDAVAGAVWSGLGGGSRR